MFRLSHILTTGALVAVCAAPASAATFEDLHATKGNGGDEGFRTSYQPAVNSGAKGQDLRSPDAVDAAQHRGIYQSKPDAYVLNREYGSPDAVDAARNAPPVKPDAYVLNRDYGSPDAIDAGRELPPVQVPVVAAQPGPSGGFDWGDAGIGAAGMLGLFSIAAACALLLTGRKRRHGLSVTTH